MVLREVRHRVRDSKGKGKGKSKLPKGIKLKKGEQSVCCAHNQGRACRANCKMANVCWFCLGEDYTGPNRSKKPNQGA